MHAQNLLKVVLKPRKSAADSSAAGQSASSGRTGGSEAPSRFPRSPSDSALESLSKSGGAASQKMVCLCAPTTHAGSFRCRLHRGSQTQWPAPASSASASKSESTPAGTMSIPDQEQRTRTFGNRPPIHKRSPSFSPPRSPEDRPSRLSKVVVAAGAEDGVGAGYKKVSASSAEGPVHISKFLSSSGRSPVVTGTMVM